MHAGEYQIHQNGQNHYVDARHFNIEHHIDGVIRIISAEYDFIDSSLSFYTHFNFEFCGHRIGATYALPKIMKQGYYRASNDELQPILSFDDCYVAICENVREHVPYKALNEGDFMFAMKHIRGVQDLENTIIQRYGVSMPNLTNDDFHKHGVAITTLRIIGKLK